MANLKIRRALLTASDKTGIVELARALRESGAELVATGKTASVLKDAGLKVRPIEEISGSPEAFQGRMKTLSFPVCSGILARRGDPSDERDLKRLAIEPIDCVVVNFYPFEAAAAQEGISRRQLIEEVDIGGPTLVRAAAKNSPDVLVLTSPEQYAQVIQELQKQGSISNETASSCAAVAWQKIFAYDSAIARELGTQGRKQLRYGENPHQSGFLEVEPDSPIAWPALENRNGNESGNDEQALTPSELSYNNITDLSAAYALASDLVELGPESTGVVIVKHGNPCGVSLVPETRSGADSAQKQALLRAWEGDPVSAFGGVIVFTHRLEEDAALWLSERFVELISAPELRKADPAFVKVLGKRKNLKAVAIRRFGEGPTQSIERVPGGSLYQIVDNGSSKETLRLVTRIKWPEKKVLLAHFGIAVCRALKSNAIALVREIPGQEGSFQLVGAGQGQPNRIEALKSLAVPRARLVLKGEGIMEELVLVSDAFFPFRDTVDAAFEAGIRFIVQPGGSIKDAESIAACDEHGLSMVFTGIRHFKH